MKYIIIGGRKCGSTSFEKYLKEKNIDVIRVEQLFTKLDGFEIYQREYNDRQPIVILRNPVDRAYSDWKYSFKKNRTKLNYRDYCLDTANYSQAIGELNPIIQSKYSIWLKKWNIKLDILSLEEMKTISDFPLENTTKGKISDIDRKWTEDKLNEM